MDNRFTVKDLFLFLLLTVLLITVVLGMFQYDRQWDTMKSVERQLMAQTGQLADMSREIAALRRTLENGIVVTGTTQPTGNGGATTASTTQQTVSADDPFYRQRQAMEKPDYARGDWLIQNFGIKVGKLTPLLSSDVYASVVQGRIMESLAYRDPYTLEYTPQLATSWKTSDDGMRITFQLRRGVVFSDGKPFTADDVVFTFDWICNEEVDAPRDRAYVKENIKAVEKVNDYEVTFVFAKPYFESFSLAASFQPMAKHFYGTRTPRQFNDSVGLLIGTGPYRLKDPEAWRPGTTIELVRNERYWGEPAPFDRLYYYEVENDAAELTMFRNGELDTFGATPEQYVKLKDDREINARANRFEYRPLDGGYTYVAWNQKRGDKATRFADKRVRQAMTMLLDRQRMARDIFLGYANVTAGPFHPASKQNAADVKPWPYDTARAKQLLKDAGYEDRDGDGVIESPTGERFEFSLIYSGKNPIGERTALFIKDSLARAGIIMKLESTDWSIMVEKLNKKDFDAITLGWSGGAETDIFQMFHSSQTVVGGDNFMFYQNPELDKLIDEARATTDEAKRMPIWQQCHRILNDDQPYTFLLDRKALLFVDKRIQNVAESPSGLNFVSRSTMPYPWFVPKAMQKHSN